MINGSMISQQWVVVPVGTVSLPARARASCCFSQLEVQRIKAVIDVVLCSEMV